MGAARGVFRQCGSHGGRAMSIRFERRAVRRERYGYPIPCIGIPGITVTGGLAPYRFHSYPQPIKTAGAYVVFVLVPSRTCLCSPAICGVRVRHRIHFPPLPIGLDTQGAFKKGVTGLQRWRRNFLWEATFFQVAAGNLRERSCSRCVAVRRPDFFAFLEPLS